MQKSKYIDNISSTDITFLQQQFEVSVICDLMTEPVPVVDSVESVVSVVVSVLVLLVAVVAVVLWVLGLVLKGSLQSTQVRSSLIRSLVRQKPAKQ